MTPDEMLAYAQACVDGGPVKKSDVLAFMKGYLAQPLHADGQAGGPGLTTQEVVAILPALPFVIEKTETGIHVPREANRAYTRAEAAALVALLYDAIK